MKEYGKKLPIKFEVYDDASKPENARKFYEKMATDPSISFFMGPFSSFISNAATTVAGKHKIPMQMVCANDAVLFEKPNYWRVGSLVPAEDEWERLVPIYKKKGGVKTFATLAMDTLHNKGAIKGFEADLKKNGFEVVYSAIAPPPTKNFAPDDYQAEEGETGCGLHRGPQPGFYHRLSETDARSGVQAQRDHRRACHQTCD